MIDDPLSLGVFRVRVVGPVVGPVARIVVVLKKRYNFVVTLTPCVVMLVLTLCCGLEVLRSLNKSTRRHQHDYA
jgi:hypothetical protein